MVDYIYCLYEVETLTKFYIGRTIDPTRRLSEHRNGSKNYQKGDELKYEYAHALDELNIEWDMEILMECGPDTDYYEDFFVNKYRHEPLQNMRAGDSEPWMGLDYVSPKDFVKARQKCLEQKKYKPITQKIARETDPEQTLFSFEKPTERFMSPAMREILAKRTNKRV